MSNISTSRPTICLPKPVVLLLHGFGSSFDNDWRRTGWVDVLADAGRSVVGRDLLGHADGARPDDPEEYARFEEHAFEPAESFAPVDAIGFSLGGLTLLRLAADDPTRFRRIAVLGIGDPVVGLRQPNAEIPLPDVLARWMERRPRPTPQPRSSGS